MSYFKEIKVIGLFFFFYKFLIIKVAGDSKGDSQSPLVKTL
jgi:hypothetical protein